MQFSDQSIRRPALVAHSWATILPASEFRGICALFTTLRTATCTKLARSYGHESCRFQVLKTFPGEANLADPEGE